MDNNRPLQVKDGHYLGGYETLPRWITHYYQIHEVLRLNKNKILEIGPGNGMVSWFLKKCGLNVVTCDIDSRNNPDFLGDVTHLPFEDNSFDIILCCEVLEHIPYSEFEIALREIRRVARDFVLISLPAPFAGIALALNLPFLAIYDLHIGMPYATEKKFDGGHYWELGRSGYSLQRIRNAMRNTGFDVIKEFRPPLSLFCCFFVLKKR